MSKNPSELLGVNKGKIEIGYEGDLVLLDLEGKLRDKFERILLKRKKYTVRWNESIWENS